MTLMTLSNVKKFALGLFACSLIFVGILLWQGCKSFGAAPDLARMTRLAVQSKYSEGSFRNTEELYNDWSGMLVNSFSAGDQREPVAKIMTNRGPSFTEEPESGLRLTWLGHSTVLIEIDGQIILTDPVWSERSSPFTWLGPQRWYAPPMALKDLPKLDAVLISHDHYDHLDYETIITLSKRGTDFIVPLGVGAHLRYWGVDKKQIREFDWWQSTNIGDLEIVCTPARHASGRHLLDRDRTLWAGYVLIGPKNRVYFSGDTGLFPAMKEIGRKYGPFDATMIEVGAYDESWPDWHIGPEQAVLAHHWLGGRVLLPIHWGLFDLALHNWTEPIERTLVAAQKSKARVITPRPGQAIEPATQEGEKWWPEIPWETAEQHPVLSTKIEN